LDVESGRYGFPTELEDDPILSLVLSGSMEYPNAEERRVFYVALTRARKRAYVLTDDNQRSVFIDQLEGEGLCELVVPSAGAARGVKCPECGGGRLLRKMTPKGEFFGCEFFPRCSGKTEVCPVCEKQGLLLVGAQFRCLLCGKSTMPCPKCGIGYLRTVPAGISKTGRPYDAFVGCSTYYPEKRVWCDGEVDTILPRANRKKRRR